MYSSFHVHFAWMNSSLLNMRPSLSARDVSPGETSIAMRRGDCISADHWTFFSQTSGDRIFSLTYKGVFCVGYFFSPSVSLPYFFLRYQSAGFFFWYHACYPPPPPLPSKRSDSRPLSKLRKFVNLANSFIIRVLYNHMRWDLRLFITRFAVREYCRCSLRGVKPLCNCLFFRVTYQPITIIIIVILIII